MVSRKRTKRGEKTISNIIEISSKHLKIGSSVWNNHAFFYALDNHTIGISGHKMDEWQEIACFAEKVPIIKDKGIIRLQIPEKFFRFYNLNTEHRVVSINSNNLLVTVWRKH